jgi:glutaredoxin
MTIEIFTAPNCSDGNAAMAILREHDLRFVEFNIASPASMAAFRARLPRGRSIPQIIINGECIGGYESLRLREKRGELAGST